MMFIWNTDKDALAQNEFAKESPVSNAKMESERHFALVFDNGIASLPSENPTQSPVAKYPAVPAPETTLAVSPTATATVTATASPTASPMSVPTFTPAQTMNALSAGAVTEVSASPVPLDSATFSRVVTELIPIAPVILITSVIMCLATLLLVRSLNKKRCRKRRLSEKTDRALSEETCTRLSIGNAHAIGRRENQEDAFGVSDISDTKLVQEHGVLAVVADGMGGLQKGEEISAAATVAALRSFPETPLHWMPSQVLLHLVAKANTEACMLTGGESGRSGSTLVAALVRSNELYFISVGDSRIYLYRSAKLIQLTRPHIYAMDLDEEAANGSLTFEEATADGQRRALTSYIGMGKLEKVDYIMNPVFLAPGDRVLLMTDGVFGTLSDTEIAAAISGDAQESAEAIENAVRNKNELHQDNYTVIVLQFK